MQTYEAREIVKSLADGIDPVDGEVFPAESCYQHPQIIRALYMAVESFDLQQKSRKRNMLNSKAGSPWTPEEEDNLVSGFDAGAKIQHQCRFIFAQWRKVVRTAVEIEPNRSVCHLRSLFYRFDRTR